MFNASVIGVSLALLLVVSLQRFTDSQHFQIFVPLLLVGISLGLAKKRILLEGTDCLQTIFALIATSVIIFSLASVGQLSRYPDLWAGFGVSVAVATHVGVVGYLMKPEGFGSGFDHEVVNKVKILILVAICFVYFPLFVQPPYGLLNLGDTTYHVLDEILAPLVGKFPYFDYSPQYTAIFGWILYPVKWLPLTPDTEMVVVLFACNIFIALIPLFVVFFVTEIQPKLSKILVLSAFLSIFCVSGYFNGASTQLKEFSLFGRFLPIVITLWLLARQLARSSTQRKPQLAILCGISLGVCLVNNPETGAALFVAIIIGSTVPLFRDRRNLVDVLVIVGSAFLVLFGYFLAGIILLGQFDLESVIGVRVRGTGLYEPTSISVIGPHVVYFAIASTVLARGLKSQFERTAEKLIVAQLQVTVGVLMLTIIVKYLARPIPQHLGQFFILGFLGGVLLVADESFSQNASLRFHFSHRIQSIALFAVAFLPLGALLQAPNPADEYKRIIEDHSGESNWSSTPGRPVDGWTPSKLNLTYDQFLDRVVLLADSLEVEKNKVSYFGIHGNVVQLVTGIRNGLGIQAPESMQFGGNRPTLACLPLYREDAEYVILYLADFPCSGFARVGSYFENRFEVYRRLDH